MMDNFNDLNNRLQGNTQLEAQLSANILELEDLILTLKVAEERSAMLAAIVDSTDNAIISKDLNGIITSWNNSANRIFGYTADEMIGKSITILIPEDRKEEEPGIIDRLQNGHRIEQFQTKRLTKSGELIDVSLNISPVKDKEGKIIGVSKIARNIAEVKRAEEKEAILSAIIANSDDAIISKDLNSIITSWNYSAERIFGYTAMEMIGQSILKLIPSDRQEEEPMILSRLKSGQRVDHFETLRLTKNGKLIDVSLTISPIKDSSGTIIGLSKIARDITDKKKEEQRKNDFIAIVSHELKTPLTSIRSYIQLALNKATKLKDTFTENLLSRAELQTHKMSTMINDFLDISRLEEGKMILNPVRFMVSDLIDEVINDMLILASEHVFIYPEVETMELEVFADRDKIYQVLTNLLGNAVKYSAPGSTVTLECKRLDDEVTFSVADQGIGISISDQHRLFERFYRVNGLENNISGFGIGLYLVSEILNLHGSKIELESEQDKGSTFLFKLAISQP